MKRFYKAAAARPCGAASFEVVLDGRPIQTPRKAPLRLPTAPLAEAIAAEWAAQGSELRPQDMPLLRLANAAIDLLPNNRVATAAAVAAYAETDLLYYRDTPGSELRRAQDAAWQPHLDWAAARYGVAFRVVTSLMPQPQPAGTAAALGRAVEAYDDMALSALGDLTALTGSLILALAVAERQVEADTAFAHSRLDETYQEARWGIDSEAARRTARRLAEVRAAARFLSLLDPGDAG